MARSSAREHYLAMMAERFIVYCEKCRGTWQRVSGRTQWLVHECARGRLLYLPEEAVDRRIGELLEGVERKEPGGCAKLSFIGPSGSRARFSVRVTRLDRTPVDLDP